MLAARVVTWTPYLSYLSQVYRDCFDVSAVLAVELTRALRIMDKFQSDSTDRSNGGSSSNGRFTSQAATAEDLLKAQTVGLVNLNDYRKRRAEAIELKERGIADVSSGATASLDGYELYTTVVQYAS
jgi:hypothetical protein